MLRTGASVELGTSLGLGDFGDLTSLDRFQSVQISL